MEDAGGKSGRRPGCHLQVDASGPGNARPAHWRLAGRFRRGEVTEGCAGGAAGRSKGLICLRVTWMRDAGGKSGRRPGCHLQVEASDPRGSGNARPAHTLEPRGHSQSHSDLRLNHHEESRTRLWARDGRWEVYACGSHGTSSIGCIPTPTHTMCRARAHHQQPPTRRPRPRTTTRPGRPPSTESSGATESMRSIPVTQRGAAERQIA